MIRLEGHPITPTRFPDNTCQVWKIEPSVWEVVKKAQQPVEVKWEFSYEGEFLELAQLKDLLDHLKIPARLVLGYLPYARQDKDVSNVTTFALHTFAKLLNTLKFESVYVLDPHSSKANRLIERFYAHYPEEEVKNALHRLPVYPDKGAREKYRDYYGDGAFADKVRNVSTGEIVSIVLRGVSVQNRDVLIIDDICDGGATFIALAEELKKAGARGIDLFVTHGLFTKGTRRLHEAGINRILTPRGEVSRRQKETNV